MPSTNENFQSGLCYFGDSILFWCVIFRYRHNSTRLQDITNRRNRWAFGELNRAVKDFLHMASRLVVDRLVAKSIGTLVIGYKKGWRQEIVIGRVNNQKLMTNPYAQLVKMLTYKACLASIQVVIQEESHTSKCSFLDLEKIGYKSRYLGRRVYRGLFRAADGRLIHADVNRALNIIRKAIPDAFSRGLAGIAVCPVRVDVFISPSAKKSSSC